MYNTNILLQLPKPADCNYLKNTTERDPVCSTCQFGHVSSYLSDGLFSRYQFCVWNQLICNFQLSGLPMVEVVVKGWYFSVSGLVWRPYTQPFSSTLCLAWFGVLTPNLSPLSSLSAFAMFYGIWHSWFIERELKIESSLDSGLVCGCGFVFCHIIVAMVT